MDHTTSRFPAELFGPGSPLRVIGHRGAAGVAPENTLPSFQHALEIGADAVELDLHCSRCGALVVIHDDTLDRTTDGAGAVESKTLEELRRLDAGYRFTPDGGRTHPFRGQGHGIPTFDEVLEAIPLPVIAEIKSARAGVALGNWLVESPESDRILVGGFNRSQVEPAGRRARWRCAYGEELRGYVLLGKLGLARLARIPRVNAAMVPERRRGLRIVTPRFVRRAHADGLGVFVWTVNDPEEMRRLFDWGVDGLLSDYPARLRRVVDERRAAGMTGAVAGSTTGSVAGSTTDSVAGSTTDSVAGSTRPEPDSSQP